jgi:hypothetical protein
MPGDTAIIRIPGSLLTAPEVEDRLTATGTVRGPREIAVQRRQPGHLAAAPVDQHANSVIPPALKRVAIQWRSGTNLRPAIDF